MVFASDDANYASALAAAMSARFEVEVADPQEAQGIGDVVKRVSATVFVYDAGSSSAPDAVHGIARSVTTLILGPDDARSMIAAVEAGALGYLSREAPFKEIEHAVLSVQEGTAVIPPFMLGSLLHHVVERRRGESAALEQLDELTPRESEVFRLAAMGLGHDGIAERLFISPATARTHLHRIFKKLDIHSKAELVALAASGGLPTSEEL